MCTEWGGAQRSQMMDSGGARGSSRDLEHSWTIQYSAFARPTHPSASWVVLFLIVLCLLAGFSYSWCQRWCGMLPKTTRVANTVSLPPKTSTWWCTGWEATEREGFNCAKFVILSVCCQMLQHRCCLEDCFVCGSYVKSVLGIWNFLRPWHTKCI